MGTGKPPEREGREESREEGGKRGGGEQEEGRRETRSPWLGDLRGLPPDTQRGKCKTHWTPWTDSGHPEEAWKDGMRPRKILQTWQRVSLV